ncbi:ABC transporter permease [Paenibacillus sp. Soil787]|uniref:ABC transporter permease n=1 Tax=Paenibacillus sp. Soil787 TaxID=1736411 RepID=UPI0006F4CA07|nr:ABC transporter permease subunit [Paenibacillus sp. Soil787]KRF42170.1 sugar ABC transporter permease [Paenibacillus sp. Soil787]
MVNTSIRKEAAYLQVRQKTNFLKQIRRNYELYLLILPAVIYFSIFKYWPMYGVQIAFKKYVAAKGFWGSPWVGFEHFERFFHSYNFWTIVKNTVGLSLYSLVVGFPVAIFIALLLNQLANERFKRFIQTVIYAPYFISTIVLVGMLNVFLSPTSGIVNHIIQLFGGEPIFFISQAGWFKTLYVLSGVWQETGFASVIYLAALAGIDPHLHEAAVMDGANKWQRIRHIDIPGIAPTILVLFTLAIGNLMNVGFEKAFLMQNDLNLDSSEIIATYVYRVGLLRAEYSYSAAIGLFNAVINFTLLITVNQIVKKLKGNGLF